MARAHGVCDRWAARAVRARGVGLGWVHAVSSHYYPHLAVHDRRGIDGIVAIGVLTGHTGTIVHDALATYDCEELAGATHAQSHQHLAGDVRKRLPFAPAARFSSAATTLPSSGIDAPFTAQPAIRIEVLPNQLEQRYQLEQRLPLLAGDHSGGTSVPVLSSARVTTQANSHDCDRIARPARDERTDVPSRLTTGRAADRLASQVQV